MCCCLGHLLLLLLLLPLSLLLPLLLLLLLLLLLGVPVLAWALLGPEMSPLPASALRVRGQQKKKRRRRRRPRCWWRRWRLQRGMERLEKWWRQGPPLLGVAWARA